MKNKKPLGKLLFSLAVFLLLTTMLSLSAFAVNYFDYENGALAHGVDHHPTNDKVYTKECYGNYKIFCGINFDYSDHGVYLAPEYYYGGKWIEDGTTVLVNEGTICYETHTSHFSSNYYWRLKVDTWGIFKGSAATGYIRNK